MENRAVTITGQILTPTHMPTRIHSSVVARWGRYLLNKTTGEFSTNRLHDTITMTAAIPMPNGLLGASWKPIAAFEHTIQSLKIRTSSHKHTL